jgi:hypothetical protein
VVSVQPAPPDSEAASTTECEAARVGCLLRGNRELGFARAAPLGSDAGVVPLASPALATRLGLAEVLSDVGAVSAATTEDPSPNLSRVTSRSEAVDRGAGCGKSARPDLWGARGAIPGSTRPSHATIISAPKQWEGSSSLALKRWSIETLLPQSTRRLSPVRGGDARRKRGAQQR